MPIPAAKTAFAAQIALGGFAVVPGVLNDDEIAALAQRLEHSPLPRSRAGARHAMKHEAIRAVANDQRLLHLAKQVLGDGAMPFRATLFDKSPTSNWLVTWHQDTALPLKERRDAPRWGPWSIKDGINYAHAPANALEQVLALRLHLDDSTVDNGPLRVLPGTHTLGVLSDEQLHDSSMSVGAIDCLVPKGGVVAMRPLIVHASSKSRSETRRRVLHIEFAHCLALEQGLHLAVA